jgi:hypothetical protein
MRLDKLCSFGTRILRVVFILLALILSGCNWFTAINRSPSYKPPQCVVPVSWHDANHLVDAKLINDVFSGSYTMTRC